MPGSKNKPKKGPPEKKTDAAKAKETEGGYASDNSSEFFRNADEAPDWDGSKGDANATETDSEPIEYATSDKDNKTKEEKVEKSGAKRGPGHSKKGTSSSVKKNAGGDKRKEKGDDSDDKNKDRKNQKKEKAIKSRASPRLGQRSSARQADAASAQSTKKKRQNSSTDDGTSAKKAKM